MSVIEAEPLSKVESLEAGEGATLAWLGQAGFLIRQGGLNIVIDAYLSNSLAEKYRGTRFAHERMAPAPVDPAALRNVDWLLCTHGHTDHMDPGTIPALLAANPQAKVLAPRAEKARAIDRGVPEARLLLIDAGERVDLGGVIVTATPAAHEDLRRTADGYLFLGYVLSGGGVTLWHSGDTIPFPGLAEWLMPFRVDLALLPVNGRDALRAANGVPGNLTLEEAVALADEIGTRAVIGHHFGLFDFNTLDPEEGEQRLAALTPQAEVRMAEMSTAYRVAPVERPPLSVLIVCRGNICRSPTADGILRAALPGHRIDSAAIMDWNVGRPPHGETMAVAAARGVALDKLVARQIRKTDFEEFDLILGMDDHNMEAIRALRPEGGHARIGRLGAYAAPGAETSIIDPWGQSREAFEAVYDQISAACERLSQFARTAQRNDRQGSEDHGFRT
ncbi:MBL fold metallo-hydrolase [Ensifer sp. ENS06]|uniref:arsenate reductase/protein-tyrosine-phosphatase family protein n=1 Tax=Ensifer sp. ENS06 TaxID=2769276 RepID=UPI000DDD88CA|nr:MBL fold metallo-hydrolase [Ensifer sp. ENS06]MBD9625039.1 MBL fold metallo-hydrolase [Ensifer sp. ENS06]